MELKLQLKGNVQLVHLKKDVPPSLELYETVILGGSIYMGRPQKELSRFITNHLSILLTKQIGLFLCAGQQDDKALEKEMNAAFPVPLQNHASAIAVLGYEYDFSKLNVMERWIVRKVAGKASSEFALSKEKILAFAQEMSDMHSR